MNEVEKAVWRGLLALGRQQALLECMALCGLQDAHPGEGGDLARAAWKALTACGVDGKVASHALVQERKKTAAALDEYLGGGHFLRSRDLSEEER